MKRDRQQKAKTEGKFVLAIPSSAELRRELEPLLKQKFGFDAELLVSRGVDPHDPDWSRIGHDWARPKDDVAFKRLARRIAESGLSS